MADTGFLTSASRTVGASGLYWFNIANIHAEDNNRAYCSSTSSGTSRLVTLYNWNASIPAGSIIDGVEAVMTAYKSSQGAVTLNYLQLIAVDSAANKGAAQAITNTSEQAFTFGGATDLWGLTITEAEANDASDFKLAVSFSLSGGAGTEDLVDVYVDSIRVKIYYHSSTAIKTVNGLAVASVKTLRSGVLIASGKTWNGVA